MVEQTGKARLQRTRRAAHPPQMRLTARDIDILRTVADYRIVRQDQLQALFFGSRSTAQYRLSHLFQHGYLARHFLPVYVGWSPTLYTLDSSGVELLRTREDCSVSIWKPQVGHEFLSHTLAIADVRVAVTLACRSLGYTLRVWQSEAAMKADYDRVSIRLPNGTSQIVPLIPDSYFVIETSTSRSHFFLELDRGTETIRRFTTKVLAYESYMQSGQYQQRYMAKSLRVLTVTQSRKRTENLQHAAQTVGPSRQFWFGVHSEMQPKYVLTFPIWSVTGKEGRFALFEP